MADGPLGENSKETLRELRHLLDENPEFVFGEISEIESLEKYDPEVSVGALGLLIDSAEVVKNPEELKKAIQLAKNLLERDLEEDHFLRVHYDLGNAYSSLRKICEESEGRSNWEKPRLEKAISHFRKALSSKGVEKLEEREICRIYTNLGNDFSEAGRFIDAIYTWSQALAIDPDFPQAKGNKGLGFFKYARIHHDPGHTEKLLLAAHEKLDEALAEGKLFPRMKRRFESGRAEIEEFFNSEITEQGLDFEKYFLRRFREGKKLS